MKSTKDIVPIVKEVETDKICTVHNERFVFVKIGSRIEEYCKSCLKKRIADEDRRIAAETVQSRMKRDTYEKLYLDSIIVDQTLLDASFDSFIATEQEEIQNKKLALEFCKYLKEGYHFNIIIQGTTGVGKSHLAYSILKDVNESKKDVSCLFITIDEMMRKIRGSYRDKQSKYTEDYCINLLSNVDYLVIDDLGAETGSITADKEASDFVQRVLYGVLNARQNKTTIVTTNLSGKSLLSMYDAKMISRLKKHKKYIVFKETKDKRETDTLPF